MADDTKAPDTRARATGAAGAAKTAFKALLAVVAFALIARKVDLADLSTRLERLTFVDVAVLLGLYGLQTVMGVVRWWRLLHRVGERVPFIALAGDVLVGVTFNMFLPTSVGGDVVRALRARRRTRVPHHAWSTSIFERIAGLVALGAIGGIAATAGLGRADAVPLALLFVILGAHALGAPGHALAIVIGIPLIFVLSMVPLTLGGHGLREGLYVVVLGALGVPSGVALGLAATFLASSIVYAAVGGVVLLVSKVPPAP